MMNDTIKKMITYFISTIVILYHRVGTQKKNAYFSDILYLYFNYAKTIG